MTTRATPGAAPCWTSSRHFFTVDDVERYIDLLAYYKINRLHLHLTDDQGWRIEINSWPNLARYGGSTAGRRWPGRLLYQADYPTIVAYAQSATLPSSPRSTCPGTPTRPWRRTPS